MIEMLGVLAIVGLLTASAIPAISNALKKHKSNRTIDQMTQIIVNVRSFFNANPTYTNLDNKMAIKFNAIPKEMIVDAENGVILNLYKGNVIIEGNKDDFKIIFEKLPKDVSVRIGTQDWGLSDSSLQQVKLN